MEFDICIMNPPYLKRGQHLTIIKKYKLLSNRICLIIPSREGNILLSDFNLKQYLKLKIYIVIKNEKMLYEKYTKEIKSDYYIHVPMTSKQLLIFYINGKYKSKVFDKRNGKYYNNFLTYSFNNYDDLQEFKNRLYKKYWCKVKGILTPNYQDILKGLNYIKSYREI